MSRRLLAAVVALLLAIDAATLVIIYAAGADRRAMAEMSPTPVLVVTQPVPQGTAAESLADYLTVEEVPAAAVVPGALSTLGDVEGQVTTVALEPGEQLLTARFAAPEEAETEFDIPEGFHQLTVQIEPRRVLGGHLSEGETVGVFVSTEDQQTHLTLHKVLVTRVQGGVTVGKNEEGQEVTDGPAETLMVTLALSAPDAEKLVYAAEFQSIWLSLEPAEAPQDGTRIVDKENVYS